MIEGSSGDLTDGCVSKAEMTNVNTFSVSEVSDQQQIFVSSLFLDSFIQQLQYVTSAAQRFVRSSEGSVSPMVRCITILYDSMKWEQVKVRQ